MERHLSHKIIASRDYLIDGSVYCCGTVVGLSLIGLVRSGYDFGNVVLTGRRTRGFPLSTHYRNLSLIDCDRYEANADQKNDYSDTGNAHCHDWHTVFDLFIDDEFAQ